jgi:peptidoglycan hydrolase-like protein with peptidoglycan-binding domain
MQQDYSDQTYSDQEEAAYLPNEKLRQARLDRDITIEEAAYQIGINPRTLGRTERGETIPDPHTRQLLRQFYKKNNDELGFTEQLARKAAMPSRRSALKLVVATAATTAATTVLLEQLVKLLSAPQLPTQTSPNGSSQSAQSQITATATPASQRHWPLLKYDLHTKSSAVRVAQWMLRARSYDVGRSGVDGIFGPSTLTAVKAFQERMSLKDQGEIDGQNWEHLIMPSWKQQRGSQVVALHELLYHKPVDSEAFISENDDTFTDQTENAVRVFQQTYQPRLAVTGKADLDTWCKLVGGDLLS